MVDGQHRLSFAALPRGNPGGREIEMEEVHRAGLAVALAGALDIALGARGDAFGRGIAIGMIVAGIASTVTSPCNFASATTYSATSKV